ncbi:sensor histidine kinase [Pseudoalteromonas sp. ZZD1]|uniref:sensor histidine kinase n=1 Tax=Pseudoalteromonas sp. ZZD1 TaxID=3139395 RepID=UPI003BA990F8
MTDNNEDYQQAYLRERSARMQAEQLVEDKSRVLYALNQELVKKVADLEHQQQLFIQAEKMATLGTLSAGIAHEINNPLAYAMSNIECLQGTRLVLDKLLKLNHEFIAGELTETELKTALIQIQTPQSFSQIREDVQELIADSSEGLRRINTIVRNLLNFARPSNNEKQLADMSDSVKNALKLLKNQLSSCKVSTDIRPLPLTWCNLASINQVMVNLLINAKQACDMASHDKGHIHVSVGFVDEKISITVSDTGCGMSEEVKMQIFNPFFTTKPVGTGTGMGMSMVYTMVTDHQGTIEVKSTEDEGTQVNCLFPVISN